MSKQEQKPSTTSLWVTVFWVKQTIPLKANAAKKTEPRCVFLEPGKPLGNRGLLSTCLSAPLDYCITQPSVARSKGTVSVCSALLASTPFPLCALFSNETGFASPPAYNSSKLQSREHSSQAALPHTG